MRGIKNVLVTGATSGIGAAIARAFAADGSRVLLVGRNERRLATAARYIPTRQLIGTARADFASTQDMAALIASVSKSLTRLDVLLHSAGEYSWTDPGNCDHREFDRLFDINVRAPYLLTQGLLPLLSRSHGLVIVINSSVVRGPGKGVAEFKATQHAMLGLMDSLRQDFNQRGVRVSSLFPGRTATPRMQRIYAREGKVYNARGLMKPAEVARVVVALAALPTAIEVTDIHLRSATPY